MTGRDDFSELISAFLDGEVTPEEQARVEERLVDNVEARRLFEEMRAMRNGLQSLPRHELDEDLSEIVLRRGERAVLADGVPVPGEESGESPPVAEDREGSATAIVATKPMPPEPASWRPLIWAVVTVAAVVLVMMMVRPWLDGSRDIARETTGESYVAGPAESDASRPHSSDDAAADGVLSGISPAEPKATADAGSTEAGELKTDHPRYRRAEPGREDLARWRGHQESGGQVVEGQGAAEGSRWNLGQDNKRRTDDVAVAGARTQPPKNQPDSGRSQKATLLGRGNQVALGGIGQLDIPTDRVVLVTLDLSPEAVRAGSFDRSLSRNDIHYGPTEEQLLRVRDAFSERDKESVESTDRVALRDLEGREAGQDLLARGDHSDVQLVYVVAPPERVRAVLQDLEQHPKSVLRIVDVDPGPETPEMKGVARKLASASKTAPLSRFSQQDGGTPAVESLNESIAAEMDEVEEEAAAPVEAEAPLSAQEPAAAPLARKPSMDSLPAAEPAQGPDFDVGDKPMPAPLAEVPPLPDVPEIAEQEKTEPGATTPPAKQPFGSKAGFSGPDDASAANSAPEGPSEEAADAIDADAPMDSAASGPKARWGGEVRGGRRDSDEDGTRDAEKEIREEARSLGGFGGGAVAGKAPGSEEEKKPSRMTKDSSRILAEGESSTDGQDAQEEKKLHVQGADDAENDDAFGAVQVPDLRQNLSEDAARRASRGEDHRGFAQRLEIPHRAPQGELAKKKGDRAKAERTPADTSDLYVRGGEGGGDSAPAAPVLAPRPSGDHGVGQGYSFKDQYAAPSDSPAPERLVRVLFVIRAVEPVVDLAADMPAEEPPASEASMAAPPAAAMEAAEIEAAAPAEP
jgi:hypothetical protein